MAVPAMPCDGWSIYLKALIIDDHPVVQDGLEILLRQLDTEVQIAKTSCLNETIRTINEHFDLVFYDILLVDQTVEEGFSALRALHLKFPETPIIVITALRDKNCVSRALEAGARAYIPKNFKSEIILSAIRLVLSGGVYVPAELFEPIHGETASPVPSVGKGIKSPSLTRRQRDVLTLLSKGCSNREIGQKLGVTEGTVKIHVAAIFKALSVTNRTQAVIAANQLGIVTNNSSSNEIDA